METTEIDREFGFIAGDAALDLVNTVHWRLSPMLRHDALTTPERLVRWSELAGVLDTNEAKLIEARAEQNPAEVSHALRVTAQLREDVHDSVINADADAARRVASLYADAQGRAELRHVEERWDWVDPVISAGTIVDRLARRAVSLLTMPPAEFGQCADEACGWVFLDTSRRHNRRWCSSNGCGDRNRAREYYRRHHSDRDLD
ncbi:CGNR zinc finger domain-containing protein [Microbacterium arabinogalactanolyticum]|uniref:CGNR zinc finger domain-containing protein n=1 Tax=Microbacterium arabinogalactanolyticum TaxID=69365 RepID=UPI004043D00B